MMITLGVGCTGDDLLSEVTFSSPITVGHYSDRSYKRHHVTDLSNWACSILPFEHRLQINERVKAMIAETYKAFVRKNIHFIRQNRSNNSNIWFQVGQEQLWLDNECSTIPQNGIIVLISWLKGAKEQLGKSSLIVGFIQNRNVSLDLNF